MTSPDHSAALKGLAKFPLLDALFGRRSRRFGVGMSIPDGPLAYTSKLPPQPLSEVERAVLVAVGTGISGWNLGIPYTEAGEADTGCNYTVRPIGRTYPSGAAAHGSEILINDDSGAYITRFRDLDASAIQEYGGVEDLERLTEFLRPHITQLSDRRIEFPPEYPYVASHNRWVANKPGSTLIIPISDQVESTFNQLWIRTGEGAVITDPKTGRVLGDPAELIAAGVIKPGRSAPLSVIEGNSRTSTTAELSIASYNVHLVMQAMGLGGWLFSGINTQAILGAVASKGVDGYGFRFDRRDEWVQPNPVGLDGYFEPLIPPYVPNMHVAAERFAERKFGPRGNHNPQRPGPYADNGGVKARTDRYSPAFVRYLGTLAQDIYDTYGKFPATQPSVGVAAYTQAHHIDLGFYDTHYKEGAYLETHAQHQRVWHGADGETGGG
jgi:hypothetical protein